MLFLSSSSLDVQFLSVSKIFQSCSESSSFCRSWWYFLDAFQFLCIFFFFVYCLHSRKDRIYFRLWSNLSTPVLMSIGTYYLPWKMLTFFLFFSSSAFSAHGLLMHSFHYWKSECLARDIVKFLLTSLPSNCCASIFPWFREEKRRKKKYSLQPSGSSLPSLLALCLV